jgi:hypothetical protein
MLLAIFVFRHCVRWATPQFADRCRASFAPEKGELNKFCSQGYARCASGITKRRELNFFALIAIR